MKIDQLTVSAKRSLLKKLFLGLYQETDEVPEEWINAMLKWMLPVLEEMAEEDFFGSEGWQHFFGVEDICHGN